MNKSYFKEKAFDNEEITEAILPMLNIYSFVFSFSSKRSECALTQKVQPLIALTHSDIDSNKILSKPAWLAIY